MHDIFAVNIFVVSTHNGLTLLAYDGITRITGLKQSLLDAMRHAMRNKRVTFHFPYSDSAALFTAFQRLLCHRVDQTS